MRVCTSILLLLLICQYAYSKKPKVTLKPEAVAPIAAFTKDDALKGMRTIKITLRLSGSAKDDVQVLFAVKSTNKSHPVLLDSAFTIKKKDFKAGDFHIDIFRVQLSQIDCLPDGETIEIIQKDSPDSIIQVPVNPIVPPVISLLPDTDTLTAYLKSDDPDKGERTTILTLELSGKQADASESYDVSFSIPAYVPSLSKPTITGLSTIRLHKADFPVDGCTKRLPVPLVVELKAVNALSASESIPILQDGNNHSAHVLVIPAKPAPTAAPPGNAPAAAPANPVETLTMACDKRGIFTILIATDSIKVYGGGKDSGCYHIDRPFSPATFSTWMIAKFPPAKTSKDCADHIADAIFEHFLWNDSAYMRCKYCKDTTAKKNAAAGDGSNVAAASKSKSGGGKSPLHLDNKFTIIHPVIKKDLDTADRSRHDTYVDLIVFRDTAAVADDTVALTVDPYNFPYKPVIESQNPVYLDHTKWQDTTVNSKKILYQKVPVFLSNPPIDTLGDDDLANIKINGGDDSYHGLRLTEKGVYIPNKPFWIELGANFDVSSGGFTPSNMYAGIFLYKKDIARGLHGKYNISFVGGAYLSKTSPSNIASDSGLVYRDGRSYINNTGNGYPIFRDTGTVTASTTITNVGIFFSPQARVTNGPADRPGWHVFLGIWTELLWQTVTTNYDYSRLGPAGVNSIAGYRSTIDSVNKFGSKTPARKMDFRSHYLGASVPVYLKLRAANLYINPVLWGLTTQQFVELDHFDDVGSVLGRTKHTWNSFYLVQFRLNEEVYGFSFTGEIRGLYGGHSKPAISLALSKKFDLDKIGEYVKSVLKF